jgi:hypothetical protein
VLLIPYLELKSALKLLIFVLSNILIYLELVNGVRERSSLF